MKLFQRLLVAPAALGLLAPISASATEANLQEISNYSEGNSGISTNSFKPLSTKNPLFISGGEGMVDSSDDFSADSFSSTTSATFTAEFAVGQVSGKVGTDGTTNREDRIGNVYAFQIDLATSFTGNDSLDVAIKAGEGDNHLQELDLNETNDQLTVDGISYTFPLGDRTTVIFGNNVEGAALYNTSCVYSGPTDTLSSCGNHSSALDVDKDVQGGTTLGASFDVGSGLTIAFGYEGEGDSADGMLTKEGLDAIGGQIAYNTDSYGLSVTFAEIETSESDDDTFTAVNAYFSPDSSTLPSISIGYEWGDDGSAADTADETTSYFVGLQWEEVGAGTLGAAVGTKTPTVEGNNEQLMYEVFYSYPVNDGMTITPLLYVKEVNTTGKSDQTGVIVKTTFSF